MISPLRNPWRALWSDAIATLITKFSHTGLIIHWMWVIFLNNNSYFYSIVIRFNVNLNWLTVTSMWCCIFIVFKFILSRYRFVWTRSESRIVIFRRSVSRFNATNWRCQKMHYIESGMHVQCRHLRIFLAPTGRNDILNAKKWS